MTNTGCHTQHAKDSADGLAITSAGQPDTATFGFLFYFLYCSCFLLLSLSRSLAPHPLSPAVHRSCTLSVRTTKTAPNNKKCPLSGAVHSCFARQQRGNGAVFKILKLMARIMVLAEGHALDFMLVFCGQRAMLMPKKQRFLCKRTSVV